MNTPVDDYFRSHLPNQADDGKRKWVYPKAPSGWFTRWRTVLAIILLAALFAGPFVWVDGHPLFLFNVLERRFIFFGVTFWPQDFYLVAIGLLTFIVFIVLFTVVFGRVFCGWACPQTIFLEMVFRKVEEWIEGDYRARQRLDAAPWTTGKIVKKTAKHVIYFLISFIIANTFLAYIIGRDQWMPLVTDNPLNHLGGLMAILVFTAVFYAVFAYVREIVCTTICPYGRLQGVMLDKNSLIVAYDYIRGEPRGKIKKNEPVPPKGDCIDCKLCVHVCPTGIDIRNGTQMECVNCTACIDVCDEVMVKIDRPKGLIRMDSQTGIETRKPFRITSRIVAYSVVLMALLGVLAYMLASRPALDVTVLRAPGQLFQREAGGRISNLYSLDVINKTYGDLPVQLRINQPGAQLRFVQPLASIKPGEQARTVFFISLPGRSIQQNSTPLTIDVVSAGKTVSQLETSFLGPVN